MEEDHSMTSNIKRRQRISTKLCSRQHKTPALVKHAKNLRDVKTIFEEVSALRNWNTDLRRLLRGLFGRNLLPLDRHTARKGMVMRRLGVE
jgi:hypothetical protein